MDEFRGDNWLTNVSLYRAKNYVEKLTGDKVTAKH